jgi:fatty acid desaturase
MTKTPRKVTDYLTREEIRALVTPTNLEGASAVAGTWFLIAAAMALVAWLPHPLTVLVALILIGGRQLGLAVLMHECAHRSLFRTRSLNDWIGKWLCAEPVWQHVDKYRKHHLEHHNHTGTERDTDIGLTTPFPVSRASMTRKIVRDLTGIAGVKRIGALLAMDLGYIEYTASVGAKPIDQKGRRFTDILRTGFENLGPVILTNAVLLGILAAIGHAWLYLLWIGAYLTTFSLFLRIRSMAEHACTERTDNMFRNTRTTYANWLARLTVAPHRVNYHIEHHLLMTVPHYRLPRMHKLLKERGALEESHVAKGYREVMRLMTLKKAAV